MSIPPDPLTPDPLTPDPIDEVLRRQLEPSRQTVQRVIAKALESPSEQHPRMPVWGWVAASAVACTLSWMVFFHQPEIQIINGSPAVAGGLDGLHEETTEPPPRLANLRLSNDGDTLRLTAPSGSTLIILKGDRP